MDIAQLRQLIDRGCYPEVLHREQVAGFIASISCEIIEIEESDGTLLSVTIDGIEHVVTYVPNEPDRQRCMCKKWRSKKGRGKCEGFYAVHYRFVPPAYLEPPPGTTKATPVQATPMPPIFQSVPNMPAYLTERESEYKAALGYAEAMASTAFRAFLFDLIPDVPQKRRGRKRLQTRDKLYAAFIKVEAKCSYETASAKTTLELTPDDSERRSLPNEQQ
jgi:hypothetical protein